MFAELNEGFCKPLKMKATGCQIVPLMKFIPCYKFSPICFNLWKETNPPKSTVSSTNVLEEDNPLLPWSEGLQAGLAWNEIGTGTVPYLTWFDSLCQTEHLMERVGALTLMERQWDCVWVLWNDCSMTWRKGSPDISHWLAVSIYPFPVTSLSSTPWSVHLFANIGQGAQTPFNHWKASTSKSGLS